MFDSPLAVALASIIGTALLGGTGFLGWWLYRREHTAKAVALEKQNEGTDIEIVEKKVNTFEDLENRIRKTLQENDKQQKELFRAEQKVSNAEVMLKIADGNLQRYEKLFKDIYTEQGRAQERERQCQEKLGIVEAKLALLEQQQQQPV